MEWIREKRNRMAAAFLTGMLAAALLAGTPGEAGGQYVLGWWGTLYPAFCFQNGEETENPSEHEAVKKDGKEEKEPEIKLSFWLAKALKRW